MSSTLLNSSDEFLARKICTEREYLEFEKNRLVEFSDGRIEVLDKPTTAHQLLVAFLYRALLRFLASRDLGLSLFAPLKVRLWTGTYREPDILFMLHAHANRMHNQ